LPVYRWGSAGDPRDRAQSPYPDHEEYPPVGKESLVGPNGFGVMVKGDSMTGRGLHDGDVVWVNPDRPYRDGGIVLGRLYDKDESETELGMVVKTYTGSGLHSSDCNGTGIVNGGRFTVIGPVVWISPAGFAPR
jgi:SOS-response transcriptional repressor LexA